MPRPRRLGDFSRRPADSGTRVRDHRSGRAHDDAHRKTLVRSAERGRRRRNARCQRDENTPRGGSHRAGRATAASPASFACRAAARDCRRARAGAAPRARAAAKATSSACPAVARDRRRARAGAVPRARVAAIAVASASFFDNAKRSRRYPHVRVLRRPPVRALQGASPDRKPPPPAESPRLRSGCPVPDRGALGRRWSSAALPERSRSVLRRVASTSVFFRALSRAVGNRDGPHQRGARGSPGCVCDQNLGRFHLRRFRRSFLVLDTDRGSRRCPLRGSVPVRRGRAPANAVARAREPPRGYNFGASATVRITSIFGLDLEARYSKARATFLVEGAREIELDVGGLRLGAGLRLLFP